jgi:hypothetical protein
MSAKVDLHVRMLMLEVGYVCLYPGTLRTFILLTRLRREEEKRLSSDVESMMVELGKLDTSQLSGRCLPPH